MLQRIIPSSGEALPVIGLGTWQTFDVPKSANPEPLQQVLNELYAGGGTLIDSSPMYGRAEEVVGTLTALDTNRSFFYATKVWTHGKEDGIKQMEQSLCKLRRQSVELMQVHNLVDWKTHLQTLTRWKESGLVKYVGITHYTDAMHGDLEKILNRVPLDFVQFNFSIMNRNAEKRLLPAAAAAGVATLINRPFGEGALFRKLNGKPLPSWAADWGIDTWSQFVLKFIIAHPAVTCVIPATRNPMHMADNLKAGTGMLPDAPLRERMAAYVASL
jgi:diketogulonate reductase-like aldo/keto reductase